MSNVHQFFKEHRRQQKNVKYAASSLFLDEAGKPIEWELRVLPTKKVEEIKWNAMNNKTGRLDAQKMAIDMTVASVVFPPLRDAELQDSYGVKNARDLLYELLTSAELDNLESKVMEICGYLDSGIDRLAGEAKNS